jgi:predicted ATPase
MAGPPPGLSAIAASAKGAGAPVVFAPIPLVGREAEIAALVQAHRAVGPDGRLLLVEGEAGIGKTRLATSADIVRSAGGAVLAARAYPGEASIAFAPIIELVRVGLGRSGAVERLRTVRPDLLREAARLVPLPEIPAAAVAGSSLDPYGQARLFEALADILVALTTGSIAGLIWLDDVGGADPSTIEFIGYLARRLRDRPVVVLVTSRSEDGRRRPRTSSGALDREGSSYELSSPDGSPMSPAGVSRAGSQVEPVVDSL